MLRASAAENHHNKLAQVAAARDRHLTDGGGHVGIGNLDIARGNFIESAFELRLSKPFAVLGEDLQHVLDFQGKREAIWLPCRPGLSETATTMW